MILVTLARKPWVLDSCRPQGEWFPMIWPLKTKDLGRFFWGSKKLWETLVIMLGHLEFSMLIYIYILLYQYYIVWICIFTYTVSYILYPAIFINIIILEVEIKFDHLIQAEKLTKKPSRWKLFGVSPQTAWIIPIWEELLSDLGTNHYRAQCLQSCTSLMGAGESPPSCWSWRFGRGVSKGLRKWNVWLSIFEA